MLGTILDKRYRIIQQLGKGGFGETYLAEDIRRMERQCVVKRLQPTSKDPYTLREAKLFFDSEARTLAKLGQHDQIPDILDYFEENEEFYLVQELVDGDSLNQEMTPAQSRPEAEVIGIISDVLNVLSYVHQCQVIHRDIKPSNLMRRYKDRKIVLIDFGAVKQVHTQYVNSQGQTTFSRVIGTPGYMPNEQAGGRPRFCSDIYSLGIVAIEALTGLHPSQLQEDPQTGEIVWHEYAKVSPQLTTIIDKMVRSHFSDRYQSTDEVLRDLKNLQFPPEPPPPPPPNNKKLVLISAFLVLGLGAFGGVRYFGLHPNQADNFFNQGLEKVEKEDWKGAIAAFDKAIEIDPNNGEAYLNRGNAHSQLKESQKAIDDYDRALTNLEQDVAGIGVQWQISEETKLLTVTSVYEKTSAFEGGLKAGDRILAIDGKSTKGQTVSDAVKLIRSGKVGTPVTLDITRATGGEFKLTLNRVSIPNSDRASAYYNRGKANSDVGNKQKAIDDYTEAIKINPSYTDAYYKRGIIRSELGNKQDAIKDYTEVIRLNSNYTDAYFKRGFIRYELGNPSGAIEDYTEVIRINPNNDAAYYNRGVARQDQGNKQDAIEDYTKAIQINPNYTNAYINRGNALGNKLEAIADYTQAITINPNYGLPYYNRGVAQGALGNDKEAIADYTQAIRLEPSRADAYYNRGNARFRLEDKQGAVADLQKAAELYQQQGKQDLYQKTLSRISQLSLIKN
ncbi:tetratricopeptide repeat protein [Nostocaceae cyanobacterium CENA369]|uniref:Tetratricopeptide repeat protein n=1 Tax=Dendronalium phyllosphericum CENA369 TaxID=1725256 RepID=A0A8J7I5T4_9NOST|nr:tetratricopeptide repeat protein [Dendronalium phyllosphericum]MBH8576525.1 tetratricopeptide repeat protein [Dendronalium phyllosphericum CENA369]